MNSSTEPSERRAGRETGKRWRPLQHSEQKTEDQSRAVGRQTVTGGSESRSGGNRVSLQHPDSFS